MEFIKNLKFNILDVVTNYVNLKKVGLSNYFGICPFHIENTPSFSININSNYFYCFGCKEKGDAIDFICKYKNYSFLETINFLKKKNYKKEPILVNNEKKELKISKLEKIIIYKLNNEIKKFFIKKLDKSNIVKSYLMKRGLNKNIIKIFKIGYCSLNSNMYNITRKYSDKILDMAGIFTKKYYSLFPGRIIFPILNFKKKVIGFAGRAIKDIKPKYLNSRKTKIFCKSKIFYGIWLTKKFIKKKNYVIIVEGYFDVISLFQNNFKNVLGIMGSNFSDYHLKSVLKITKNIIFCLDADSAGILGGGKILKLLIINGFLTKNIRFIILPKLYDPDNFLKRFGVKKFFLKIKKSYNLKKTFYMFYIKNIFLLKSNILNNLLEIKLIINKTLNYKDKLLLFYLISNNKKFALNHFIFLIDNDKQILNKINKKFNNFDDYFENKVLFFLLIYPKIFYCIKSYLTDYIHLFKRFYLLDILIKAIDKLVDINFIELFLIIVKNKYYSYFKEIIFKACNIKVFILLNFRNNKSEKLFLKKKLINFIFFLKNFIEKKINTNNEN